MKSPAPPSSNVAGGLAPKIHRLWDAGCSGVQTSTTFSAPWMKTCSSPRSLSRPLSAHCRDKACVALPWAGMGMPIRDSLDNPGPVSHRGAGLGLPRAGSPGKGTTHVPYCPSVQQSMGQRGTRPENVAAHAPEVHPALGKVTAAGRVQSCHVCPLPVTWPPQPARSALQSRGPCVSRCPALSAALKRTEGCFSLGDQM